MMTNLFSIFDPSLSLFNSFFFTFFLFFLFLPFFYWMNSSVVYYMKNFSDFLIMEIKYSLSFFSKGVLKVFVSVFFMLLMYNFFAMFPFFFSFTSHMSVTLPLSFSLWLMVIIFFLVNFMTKFLSHLIPVGTPLLLMSFMVLVELISNVIRPIALTFRLTANMMAGHLLMSLIGSVLVSLKFSFMVMGSFLQFFLILMELGVSFIQTYVFFTLLVLYTSEF